PNDHFDTAVVFGTPGILKERLIEKNIRTIEIPTLGRDINPFLDLKSFFELLAIFRKEKPDIVHLNSSKIGGLGALAARIAGIKKIIFTAHGWVFNEDRNGISKAIIYFLSWLTVLFSHHVIVLGEHEQQQGEAMFLAYKKIVKISNGINEPVFKDRGSARTFIQSKVVVTLDEKIPWIVTIGELHSNKGYRYALEAFEKLKTPAYYFIIGEGEDRPLLEKIIVEKNLGSRIFLLGAIPDAAKYLKAFDIFMLSSVKEGLPYVLLEAGFAKLPIIATHVGNIPEIVPIEDFIVPPKNPAGLHLALSHLLADRVLSEMYSETLYEKVRSEYDLGKTVDKTIALYRNHTI
ncbi:MAG: glycosyl transferase family protein, partial [Candidatus Paceibacter sp.]|nr:glycosyl transferase family protein [Candidatus Paceibacter sp.]